MSTVVLVIVVSINDVVLSSIKIGSVVLEGLIVVRVSKNVIGMHSLKVELVIAHPAILNAFLGLVQHRHDSILHRVLFFHEGPFFVIVIEAVLIQVDLFVNLEILDQHASAALFGKPCEWSIEHKVE